MEEVLLFVVSSQSARRRKSRRKFAVKYQKLPKELKAADSIILDSGVQVVIERVVYEIEHSLWTFQTVAKSDTEIQKLFDADNGWTDRYHA
jgi:hypothetical protein